jgi:hypothetical protein
VYGVSGDSGYPTLPGVCLAHAWHVPGACLARAWRVPGKCVHGAHLGDLLDNRVSLTMGVARALGGRPE